MNFLASLLTRKSKPKLPPGYEIRKADNKGNFLEVRDPKGWYLGCVVVLSFGNPLKEAREIAWNHFNGKGENSVVEKG